MTRGACKGAYYQGHLPSAFTAFVLRTSKRADKNLAEIWAKDREPRCGLGFRVWGLGFRVQASRSLAFDLQCARIRI